jgi:predicted transcriptional regulator
MSDSKEITTGEARELADRKGDEPRGISVGQRLELLREALTNPDVQPEKAVAMAELMFKLEDRDARAAFIAAKVAAISEMPHIGKSGQNTHTGSRYAKWETMQPLITPVLSRHGLVLNFDVGSDNGRVTVAPILSGWGWEERGSPILLPADTGKGRNDVQAVVSSVSYGKRTVAKAMLNLIERGIIEDDDGNAAGGTPLDPYEALSPEERALVDKGREMAAEGAEKYGDWFKALSTGERGFLAYNKGQGGHTWHAQNKELAEKIG